MTWFKREEAKTGYEVDSEGVIIYQVLFRGDAPDGVILEPIPEGISNPKWNFDTNEWEEQSNEA